MPGQGPDFLPSLHIMADGERPVGRQDTKCVPVRLEWWEASVSQEFKGDGDSNPPLLSGPTDDPSEQKPFVLALAPRLCCPPLSPHTLSGPLEQGDLPVSCDSDKQGWLGAVGRY